MKTILYGGFFDPIHNGHIAIAKKALSTINADRVIFIPCYISPTSKKLSSKFIDREKMLSLAILTYPKFEVSNIESELEGVSYTYKTVQKFKQKNINDNLYILIGSDQYSSLDGWKNVDEIRKHATVIVYPRGNRVVTKINESDIILLGKFIDVASSSLILKMEEDKINSDVLDYINDNGIYGVKRMKTYGVSDYRIDHSIQVANLGLKFSKKYGIKLSKQAFVSGLYHDFFKEANQELLEKIALEKLEMKNYKSWRVLHGPVGAYLIQKWFCFHDNEVIDAIRDHVLLENPEKLLNKIVFCADKLAFRNKGNLKDREIITEIAVNDIEQAYIMIKSQLKIIYGNN